MQIELRLVGALRLERFKQKTVEFPEGATIADIIQQLNIPRKTHGLVLINGRHAKVTDTPKDGDSVTVLPILGGG